MNVYLDSSVVLRWLLRAPGALGGREQWRAVYASALLRVEVCRVLDRYRLESLLDDAQRVEVQRQFADLWDRLHVAPVNEDVLRLASRPFSTRVATLDAIHLATALLLFQGGVPDLAMATHDTALGRAAQVEGLTVVGL